MAIHIDELIKTKWGQGNGSGTLYNNYCKFKLDANVVSNGTVIKKKGSEVICNAGCGAVALAQLVAYYGRDGINKVGSDGKSIINIKYKRGCGAPFDYNEMLDKAYKKTTLNGTYNGIDCRYIATKQPPVVEFDYDNMPDTLTNNSSVALKNAVALLIYYCGRAISSRYGNYGSSLGTISYPEGWTGPSLKFTTPKIYYEASSATIFKNKLIEELKAKRPVLMSGYNTDSTNLNKKGGHLFLCDGYDEASDTFHFNWGYEGEGNNWCKLDSLTFYKGGKQYNKSAFKYIVTNYYPGFIMGDCTDLNITKATGNVIKLGDDCISIEDALVMATNMLIDPNHEIGIDLKPYLSKTTGNPTCLAVRYSQDAARYNRDIPFIKCDLDNDYVVTNNDLKLMLNKALRKKLF